MHVTLKFGKLLRCPIKIQVSFYCKFNICNFDEYFTKSFDKCKRSIKDRNNNLNLDHLNQEYKNYANLLAEINALENEKETIVEKMKLSIAQKSSAVDEIREKGRTIRRHLKDLMVKALPAFLSPMTPPKDTTLFESGELNFGRNHINICGSKIELRSYPLDNNEQIVVSYMSGDIALLEHNLYYKLLDQLKYLKDYSHLIYPDMVKEFVSEACLEENQRAINILQTSADTKSEEASARNLMLLGSSLPGFLSYISTLDIDSIHFPNKFYSLGRNYMKGGNTDHGLYGLSQNIQGELFSTTTNQDELQQLFEEQKTFALNLYQTLGLPFKVIESAAHNLSANESRRIDFYLWSSGFNKYFKCGYLRCLDDHISRKLSLYHQGDKCFLKMNHSVVFKLPVIAAALIENKSSKLHQTSSI